MKKALLLSAAACALAVSANAENFVTNGNFEAPGFEQSVPGGYTWDPWNTQMYLTVLPGWSMSTGGEWNGGIELITEDPGDGEARPEDDNNYAHYVAYNDNGWDKIRLEQVVEGLTAGTQYDFSYLTEVNWVPADQTANGWAPDPDYGYVISEVDVNAEGKQIAGKSILSKNLGELAGTADEVTSDEWKKVTTNFTAPADGKVHISIYLNNGYGDKNKKDGLWMNVDMVSVNRPGMESVNNILSEEGEVLGIYNLQGIRVADNLESLEQNKGMYIVRKTNGSVKVIR